jgi:hypothetical protein
MELKKAFERFKSIPFPDDSFTNEELSDIHSEIALYDTITAGNVDTILSGKKNIALENDDILKMKLESLLKKSDLSGSDYQAALKMKEYLFEIDVLISVARSYLSK